VRPPRGRDENGREDRDEVTVEGRDDEDQAVGSDEPERHCRRKRISRSHAIPHPHAEPRMVGPASALKEEAAPGATRQGGEAKVSPRAERHDEPGFRFEQSAQEP